MRFLIYTTISGRPIRFSSCRSFVLSGIKEYFYIYEMEIAHIQTPLGIAKITGNENGFPLFLFQMKELFRLQFPVLKQRLLNEYFEGKT
jgi:hypothetical protein